MNPFNLKNKKIFIGGGYGLLGSSVVNICNSLGAKIVVIEKVENKKKKLNGIEYIFFDISKINKLELNFKKLTDRHGVPDGFINCSWPKTKDWKKTSFKKINPEIFKKNIEIHMNSFILAAKIVADKMKQKKIKGSIVQLGSIYGSLGQDSNLYKNNSMFESMAYTTIKGGIINNVRALASFYGEYSVRVNSLSPGGIYDNQNKKFLNEYKKKTPLKRMAKAEEIANAAAFLLSDASSYISGIDLIVDGGFSIT